MKIVNKKTNNFTTIPNSLICDKKLTPKAKWILIYILSRPFDWHVYENDIKNHSNIGRDAVRSGLQELIKHRYIERFKLRDEKGHFRGYEYYAHEKPINSSTLSEDGFSDIGKPAPTNKEVTKRESFNQVLQSLRPYIDTVEFYHNLQDETQAETLKEDVEAKGLTWTKTCRGINMAISDPLPCREHMAFDCPECGILDFGLNLGVQRYLTEYWKRLKIQRDMQYNILTKQQQPAFTPPRYDEVYFEGLAWLDTL